MEQNFFTLGALPSRMKKLGDNIEHLYHTANRTVVNAELVEHKVDGIYVQFGADEYNQIVVTFTNQFGAESDKFVVRGRELATVVDTINKVYKKLISKNFKTMRKEKKTVAKPTEVSNLVSNVTPVTSVNSSVPADVNMLVEFILQQHARSGNLYEALEFVDVPRLYLTKSYGAVSNVVFNGDHIAIEGAISISFCVVGLNQSELREQVLWALQTVVERNKLLVERANDSTEQMESVAENKAEVGREVKNATTTKPLSGKVGKKAVERYNDAVGKGVDALESSLKGLTPSASGQKIRCFLNKAEVGGEFKNATKVKPFRGKVNEKAVERFNEAVSRGVDVLEPSLKGLSPSALGQKIRCFLNKAAHDSNLKLPDTTGVTLAKNLSQYNVELLLILCEAVGCKVPSFLQMKTATVTSSSKSVMKA